MLQVPAPAPAAEVTRRLLSEAANRGEALVSVARIGLCVLVLLRFFAIGAFAPGGDMRARIEVPTLAVAIAASVAGWRFARRGHFEAKWLVASTLLDALVCFASLLSTVLWPPEAYAGLLRSPDPSAVIAVVFVSALRLSPVAVWVGTSSNLAALLTLVAVDRHLHGAQVGYDASDLVLLVIFTGASGVVAAVACSSARRMVVRAGEEAAHLARARWQFGMLLREQHDVRNLLSSAKLRAELLLRRRSSDDHQIHARAIVRDLKALATLIEEGKMQALGELAALEGATEVDVTDALRRCAELVRSRFPAVRIELEAEGEVRARMMGGSRAIGHVLTNLLVNACEGDGSRGAERITVEVHDDSSDRVRVRVRDDGPGFRSGVLSGNRPLGGTTKDQGSGLGMLLVATLIEASGGEFRAGNAPEGGAEVVFALPRAP